MKADNVKIYTVSEINTLIKGVLEENLPPMLSIAGRVETVLSDLLPTCAR